MAYKNKILRNSITGQDIRFLQTAADTNGELLEMESTWNSKTGQPPPHFHPKQAEDFTVLEGELHAIINGELKIYKKGDQFHVPAGTIHSMWNAAGEKARVNWKIRPALITENFFETTTGLANDGKTNGKGVPNILQASLLLRHFDSVLRLTKPSKPIQMIVFGTLAPIARLLGYKPVYKKYIH